MYINDNDNEHFYESDFNAEYDGTDANISLKTNNDGNKHSVKFLLDKEGLLRLNKEEPQKLEIDDLVSILNLDEQFENDKQENTIYDRLMNDFISSENISSSDPKTYYIELPTKNTNTNSLPPRIEELFKKENEYDNSENPNISNSNLLQEEMVVPFVLMNLQSRKTRKTRTRKTKKIRTKKTRTKKTRTKKTKTRK